MKRTLIALGIFAVLLVAVLLTREEQVNVGVAKLELPRLEKAKVTSIEVSGASAAKLLREGSGWVVVDPKRPEQKHAAEQLQVDSALDAIADFRAGELVTEKAERHAELEVDDAKGLKVKVAAEGGQLFELVFGKSAKSGGVYVRQPKGNAVWVTQSPLPWQMRKDVAGWRKRAFVNAKVEDVTRLSVTLDDGSTLALVQKDGAWKLDETMKPPSDFRFDASAAQRLAQQLASLSAQDFAEPSASEELLGLTGPHAVVEAATKDGRTLKLHLGRGAEPDASVLATALQGQFDALDAAWTKDGKLTKEELAKIASDASKSEEVKRAAKKLSEDAMLFTRFDVGLFAASPKDDAVSANDLAAVVRTAGVVPAKLEGDAQIYLVPSYAAAGLKKRLDDMRDMSLLSFDTAKATKLTIVASGKRTVVAREGESWKLLEPKAVPSGYELDPVQVVAQLDTLRNLRASRLAPEAKPQHVAKPSATVEIAVEGSPVQRLVFGAERAGASGSKELYVKGSIDGHIYAIDPWIRDRLATGHELFRKPAPPPNVGSIKGLEQLPPEVRQKLEAQLQLRQ